MIKEETNNTSLIAALHPPLPPVPSKNPLILSLSIINPAINIAAADLGTLAAIFLSLSTKVQLNSILNCK